MKKLSLIGLAGTLIAVAIGVAFNRIYPLVEISAELALLFAVIGVVIAAALAAVFQRAKDGKGGDGGGR